MRIFLQFLVQLKNWKRPILLLSQPLPSCRDKRSTIVKCEEKIDDSPIAEDDKDEDGADAARDGFMLAGLFVGQRDDLGVLVKVLEKFLNASRHTLLYFK